MLQVDFLLYRQKLLLRQNFHPKVINFLSVAYEADENGYRVTKMDVEVKLIYIDIIQSDWEKIITV